MSEKQSNPDCPQLGKPRFLAYGSGLFYSAFSFHTSSFSPTAYHHGMGQKTSCEKKGGK